jgi:hypothetical protein
LAGLPKHFFKLKTIIANINAANSEDQCVEALETLYEEIKSMANQHRFILKEGSIALPNLAVAQGVLTNLVRNLFENITDLQKHLKKYQETPCIEQEEKTKIPEPRRINQSKSAHILSEEKKEQDEILAPIDLLNITLKYNEFNEIKGHGSVPLVPTLFNSIKIQKLARLKVLLTAIANGEFCKVKEIIEKDPSLLLDRLEKEDCVETLSGQKANNVTALRTALAVEDTQMATMIKDKLITIAGEDVAKAQYHEQFPKGCEVDEEKRWAPLFTQLDTLSDIIKEKKGDITSSGDPKYKVTVAEGSAVEVALTKLRSLLDDALNDKVRTGRHFNINLVLQAYKIYQECYEAFGNDGRDLFWQRVIGTMQRGLPPPWIQAFCKSVYVTQDKLRTNIPQDRSFKIELLDTERTDLDVWIPSDFYPLSRSRLGFDYALCSVWGQNALSGARQRFDASLLNLVSIKTAYMQTFTSQLQNIRGISSP